MVTRSLRRKWPLAPLREASSPSEVRSFRRQSVAERASRALRTAALVIWSGVFSCLPGAPALGADGAQREALRQRIESLRTGGDPILGAGSDAARALIAGLYEQRGFAPLWADEARERALLSAIAGSRSHGLDPRDYHAAALAGRAAPAQPLATAERELLLTDAFVRLAYHLHFGKADPRALQHGWNFPRSLGGEDPAQALARLTAQADPSAALESLAPALPVYRDLRRALERLRAIESAGGWPPVGDGAKLDAGSRGPRVAQLRARLRAGGDLPDGPDGDAFDAELEAAVRRFQARHGLEADGVVGRATLAALNVPVSGRIDQVRANLERLRWVSRELTGDYLLVDIAGFDAELWLDGARAWQARVVVGRPFRRTPEFRAPMKYLVLNPEWHVPPTILREDLLPKLARDPGHLARQHMRVLDSAGRTVDPVTVDWQRYGAQSRAFPYQIVQAPGPDNPLGRVKFMFPNAHAVYLHDTPARGLFDRSVRAFSSGCIRIERPLELAERLLDDAQRWGAEQLREAIDSGRTTTVTIRRQVPVLLLYFTATAADGEIRFRPDLYGRDAPIVRALAAPFRFAPLDVGRR